MNILRKVAAKTAASCLLGILATLFWTQAAPVSGGSQIDYHNRELRASKRIRSRLQQLRKLAEARKWGFSVGYTSAMDYDLPKITGIRLPQNVVQLVKQQNTRATTFLQGVTPKISAPADCSAGAASFDWRKFNGVTPVRDQGACGSCWAFGTISAFEAGWRITNGEAIDTSEQDVLDCSRAGSCSGGWWAFDYLIDDGVATEASYPYRAKQGRCSDSAARPFRAATWGYVDVGDVSDRAHVGKLKEALCRYGPLAVTVLATDAFQAYTGDVFNECASGEINHAVTLIGWDDNKQAWLIKNSWGTGWGDSCGYGSERGYMWIAYGCNKIGAYAAWVYALPKGPAGAENYEVTMFERPGFAGKRLVYSLPDASCQKLNPQFDTLKLGNRIASIKVGAKVGAALFENREYGGRYYKVTGDVANVRARKFNEKPASLIVYRREDGGPVGVILMGSKTAFYPLTESCANSGYSKLVYSNDATKVAFSGFQARPKWKGVKAILYRDAAFKGKMQAFPAEPPSDRSFDVGKDLKRKSSSLSIEIEKE